MNLDELIRRIPEDGDPFKDIVHIALDVMVRGVLADNVPCVGKPHGGRPCVRCSSELMLKQTEQALAKAATP